MHQESHEDEMLICVLIRWFTENAICVACSGESKMFLIILFQPFSHHQACVNSFNIILNSSHLSYD